MAERLYPGSIAERLFGLAPDRDEQAPQLCQEALLTLMRNGYEQAGSELVASPKKHLQNEGLCLLTWNLSAVSSTVGGHGGAVSL